MNLRERIDEARLNGKTFSGDPKEEAGRVAEYRVGRELSARLRNSGWTLHCTLRVPDSQTRRRRELDYVITAPDRVLVVELKNWSGKVAMDCGHVVQERIVYSGGRLAHEMVDHGPLFEDLTARVEVLKRHHERHADTSAPPIQSLVVFYNRRVRLSQEILEREDVLAYDALLSQLPDRRLRPASVLAAVMRHFGWEAKQGKSPTPNVVSIRQTFDDLGCWDTIEVHGGKVVFGDIMHGAANSPRLGTFKIERRNVTAVELAVDRSVLKAVLFQPRIDARVTFRDGSTARFEKLPEGQLHYQAAGAEIPGAISLRHVVRFQFGYSERPKFGPSWKELKAGAILDGRVASVAEFGVFVDFDGPVHGLLRISKLPHGKINKERLEKLYPRQTRLQVKVLRVDTEQQQVELILP